jgi:penicillin-binding protein 2
MRFPRFFSSDPGTGEIDDAVLTLTEKEAAKIEWPINRLPLRFVFFGIGVVLVVFGGRLVYLNVVKGEYYRSVAENNSIRSLVVSAPRGLITDRFGELLVRNVPSLDAIILPNALPRDRGDRSRVLEQAAALFRPESDDWKREEWLTENTLQAPLLLKKNVSQEEAIIFLNQARELPGIALTKTARREYIDGPVFAHLLGFEGKIIPAELEEHPGYLMTDSIGKQGIEKSHESDLRGRHGSQLVEVDALGNVKNELGIVPPVPGNDLTLTVDAGLQRTLYHTMAEWLQQRGLERGAAVALDPRDGSLRALVSFPSFDNNLFSRGISAEAYATLSEDSNMPLFNRAVSGEYPPGSTFKPIIASAALAERIITPETEIESRGGISVGRFFFGAWTAHGFTDLRRALAVSSDVYFYSLGGGYGGIGGLGIERMKAYAARFGLGVPTGIDLPGEADGFLPDPAWKERRFNERWYVGDDYITAIGQGFVTATPLQIANAIAAIANGGTLFTPRTVAAVRDARGKITPFQPNTHRSGVVSSDILKVVREGMRETVTEGTAQSLRDLPVSIAGKTGTAQYGGNDKTHGWFVSFAPYEQPELVLLILVEGQGDETYNAVPITKTVYEWYFSRPKEPSIEP